MGEVGVITDAGAVIARGVITHWLTAVLALASLALIVRWKASGPLLVLAAGLIGLLAYR